MTQHGGRLFATWIVSCCCMAFVSVADTPPVEADPDLRDYLSGNGLLNRGLYDLAATEYRKFLDEHPDHDKVPVARYGLAVCLQRTARHEEAVAVLQPIIGSVPAGFSFAAESFVLVGQSHMALEQFEQAARSFRRVVDGYAMSDVAPAAGAALVEALYRDGAYGDAEKVANHITRKWPSSALHGRALFIGALATEARGNFEQAARAFTVFIERYPQDPLVIQVQLHLARCSQQLGRYAAARASYEAVLRRADHPVAPDARFGLAVIDAIEGRFDVAQKSLQALLEQPLSPPLAAAARLELGRVLLQAGQVEQAAATLGTLQGQQLATDESTYLLGKCRLRQERWRDAVATLDRAIATWPDSHLLPEMQYDRAVALVRAGDDEAPAALTGFRARFPDHALAADALEALAHEAHRRGQYDESREYCRLFIEEHAAHEHAGEVTFLLAENHYLAGRYEEATPVYRRVLAGHAEMPQAELAEFRLGMALYRLDHYAEAIPILERVAGRSMEHTRPALIALGDMYFAANEFEDADQWFTRYIDDAADQPAIADALIKRGLARQRVGRGREALADYERLMVAFPDSPHRIQALFERGQILLNDQRPLEASIAFERVLAEGPESRFAPHAQRHLGTIALQSGDYVAASQRLASLAANGADSELAAGALIDRGQALSATGKHAEASEVFTELLRQHPDHPRVMEVRARQAIALSRLERWAAALAAIEDVESSGLDPKLAAAVAYERAWCFRSLGRDEEAAQAYRRLLGSGGQAELGPHATIELAELEFRSGRHAQAVRLIEQLDHSGAMGEAVSEQALYLWGVSLFEMQRVQAAADILERYLAQYPQGSQSASALFFAGEARFAHSDYARAAKHLGQLIDNCPAEGHCAAGLLRLGECYAQLQQWSKSEQAFADYLDHHGNSEHAFQARFGRGWARENMGRFPEAIDAYRQVIATHQGPTAARAQFQIGECLFAQKQHREAVSEFLKVDIHYGYDEWSAAALYEAGRCFEALTEPQRARAHYDQVMADHGASRWAGMASKRLAALGDG